MNGARLAEWILFHRFYVNRYNAFMDVCPAGFKFILDELGIVSCDRKINRKNMVVFEATDDIARGQKIADHDCFVISLYRKRCVDLVIKVATLYRDYPVKPLEPYEAYLLSDWLGIDIGVYIPIKFSENTL